MNEDTLSPLSRLLTWFRKYVKQIVAIYNVLIWFVMYSVFHVTLTFGIVTMMHNGLQYRFAGTLLRHGDYMVTQLTALFVIGLLLFSIITLIIGWASKSEPKKQNYQELVKHTWLAGLDFIGSVSVIIIIICVLIFPELAKGQVITSVVFALLLHTYKSIITRKEQ
ncbi:hypothetical protein [Lactiplantibacillus plantarum]|uniref:hypothetical protein n=1 Tax=Lactiplantibacillus plantarum TaxID=1590 RepID=UPI001BAC72C9|nr:hypothetical protein [Lactiplantibacillus plantarum]MBS0954959.1 hypothetical protein [Lactiplantibacillus plantarum]